MQACASSGEIVRRRSPATPARNCRRCPQHEIQRDRPVTGAVATQLRRQAGRQMPYRVTAASGTHQVPRQRRAGCIRSRHTGRRAFEQQNPGRHLGWLARTARPGTSGSAQDDGRSIACRGVPAAPTSLEIQSRNMPGRHHHTIRRGTPTCFGILPEAARDRRRGFHGRLTITGRATRCAAARRWLTVARRRFGRHLTAGLSAGYSLNNTIGPRRSGFCTSISG